MIAKKTQRLQSALGVLFVIAALFALTIWNRRVVVSRISITNADLAVGNLNSQIASLEKILAEQPNRIEFRKQLFGLLTTRTQFLGNYSDFERLQSLTSDEAASIDEILLRARFFAATHQFDLAVAALDKAKNLDSDNRLVQRQRIPIRLARRENLPELREFQQSELALSRTYNNFVLMAGIESDLGNYDQADFYFEEALKNFHDTSPFPVAGIYFQRALMWAEKAGDSARAELYYREALHYLPQYVLAHVHLAEILAAKGDIKGAVFLLEPVSLASDPEARGLQGELLIKLGRNSDAAPLINSAKAAYNQLLVQFPLAFADHAAEFFADAGEEPERALEYAKINLSNRKSEHSYLVAINAARAARSQSEACAFSAEARAISPRYAPLIELLAQTTQDCVK